MEIKELSVDKITGSVYQPRLQPLDSDRHRLVGSIKRNGLQVPIIVMREQGNVLLVCGHRRVDALEALRREGAKALPAGMARISRGKVMVQAVDLGPVSRKAAALTAFIENDERINLTPYENASCFKAFVEKFGLTKKALAETLSKDRHAVGDLIRALDGKSLTPVMIKSWKARKLQLGHIQALLRLSDRRSDQVGLYKKILAENLSASMARFWSDRMLTPAERRLDRRSLDRLAKAFLDFPELREAIDDKELLVKPSRTGSRMDLTYNSTEDLRHKLEAMLACLDGLQG